MAGAHVEHDFLDVAQVVVVVVDYAVTSERGGTHQLWSGAVFARRAGGASGVGPVHAIRIAVFVIHSYSWNWEEIGEKGN